MAQTKKVSKNNTKITKDGVVTIVTYHWTEVVRFDSKRIVLNTGGFDTTSTRRRMNQASNEFKLGYSVYTKKGDTLVDFKGVTIPFNGTVLTLER